MLNKKKEKEKEKNIYIYSCKKFRPNGIRLRIQFRSFVFDQNISNVKQSSLPRHFLRTLKFLIKLSGVKACSTLKCFPVTECLCSSTR